MNNKIYSIELLRFLFMTIICLWHFRMAVLTCNHGYLAVEFYFILSGYLLYHSFKGGKYADAMDYTLKKIKRFYLPYILMLPICIVIFYRNWISKSIVDGVNYILIECMMLQQSPISSDTPLNHTLWYITTLLFAGFLLYYLLQKNLKIELIIISLVGYGWLTTKYGQLDFTLNEYSGLLLLARGFCGMSLGAGLAMLKEIVKLNTCALRIMDVISIYALIAFLYLCFTPFTVKENESIILAAIVIFTFFQPNSFYNRILKFKCLASFGAISFYMLLVHAPICRSAEFILRHYNFRISNCFLIIAYISIVILASILLRWTEHRIQRTLNG